MPCAQELFCYVSLIAVVLCIIYPSFHRYFHHRRSRKSFNGPLEGIYALLGPKGIPLPQLLEERAMANTRLSSALGLTNTFVDPDPSVHSEFVKRSRRLLRKAQAGGWTRFKEVCGQAVESTLDDARSSTIDFDCFVQAVVLRSILVAFLDVGKDVDELDLESVNAVTNLINELWTISKSGPPPPHLSQQLHEHLRRLVPISADFANPIDFVVPTWETMWRVCATTIARVQESRKYEHLFCEVLDADTLTTECLTASCSHGFSVRDFVNEAMRLHPPVKHIHRRSIAPKHGASYPTLWSSVINRIKSWIVAPILGLPEDTCPASVKSADIEAALREQSIWGEDEGIFNPLRHQTATSKMTETSKLVFGYGPLRCVAAAWAPDAAAVMSGMIITECTRLGWKIVRGDRIGSRNGWDGWRLVKSEGSYSEA